MHLLGISIFISTRQTIFKTIHEKNNFKCCHQTSCFHVSFLCCKLVPKGESHMQYIYALCIPTSEEDRSQTTIPLRRSHNLTVAIKKPTRCKKKKKSIQVSSHMLVKYLFALCAYIHTAVVAVDILYITSGLCFGFAAAYPGR